jgi:hypothetical protein
VDVDRRREVLEAIIDSSDPGVTATERLKALELLRDLDGDLPPNLTHLLRVQAYAVADDELDRWLDAVMAAVVRGEGVDAGRYPETARALREVAERGPAMAHGPAIGYSDDPGWPL